jgi:methylmalonyl-CoA mutase N-terminal domain/subunit
MRDAFKKRQSKIEAGEEKVIGINRYIMDEVDFENVFRTNPEAARIEIDRIRNLKERRDNRKLEEALDKLRKVCEKEENVLPVIMEATKEGATVGEICAIYREIFKIWEPPIVV